MTLGHDYVRTSSPEQARELQEQLAPRVRHKPLATAVRLVAGTDCAYSEDDSVCAAAVVVWDLDGQVVVEVEAVLSEVSFPYIPGLLAFREAPAVLKVLERLNSQPLVLICDGHGIAHPRRFGLASHVGVSAGIPTIGCSKRRLCGTFVDPDSDRGSSSPLLDRGEIIGLVLRTRSGVKPVFVSVGHLIDLPAAERIVVDCTPRFRLPEPLRLAHLHAAMALKQKLGDLE
jgi:deoxyribonuclease V